VIKRLLSRFANSRRPDVIEDDHLTWELFATSRYRVVLDLMFRGEDLDDFRPTQHEMWALLLSGKMQIREKISSLTTGRFLLMYDMAAPKVVHVRAERAANFQIPPSKTFEDGMITFDWMAPTERIFDAGQPVWAIVVFRV